MLINDYWRKDASMLVSHMVAWNADVKSLKIEETDVEFSAELTLSLLARIERLTCSRVQNAKKSIGNVALHMIAF